MKLTTIIIPLWNGESCINTCLQSVLAQHNSPLEIIVVDNASSDESASLVTQNYPQVQLLSQPVNLGFAGGVNVGLKAAQGDLLILLNQDCVVQENWLSALIEAFEEYPKFGIAGCTIFNHDGTVNHTGAYLQKPLAYGIHRTEIGDNQPYCVEYVTGAALAIRRTVWETIGPLDEGFYPAYYEESDYCYRARQHGFEIGYVPTAKVTHLLSGREWQADPIKHTANQHRSRFRFISKYFEGEQISQFFEAEYTAITVESYQDQLIGRMLGARDTLSHFDEIIEKRFSDRGSKLTPAEQKLFERNFTKILQQSFNRLKELVNADLTNPPINEWQAYNHQLKQTLTEAIKNIQIFNQETQQSLKNSIEEVVTNSKSLNKEFQNLSLENSITDIDDLKQKLQTLKDQEYNLLQRIYFRSPTDTSIEKWWQRLVRLFIYRPLSFISGREHLLLAELNTVHVARIDLLTQINDVFLTQIDKLRQINDLQFDKLRQINDLRFDYQHHQLQHLIYQINLTNQHFSEISQLLQELISEYMTQIEWIQSYYQQSITRRLQLLEALVHYEYR